MTKGCDTMKETVTLAFGGFKVRDLVFDVQSNPSQVGEFKCIYLLVGTNDLGSKAEYQDYVLYVSGKLSKTQFYRRQVHWSRVCDIQAFKNDYLWLVQTLRWANPSAIFLLSAILPRPWDYKVRDRVRVDFNDAIREVAWETRNIYVAADRAFLKFGVLREAYFGKKGLHLNDAGSMALQSFVSDKLRKAVKGQIY